MLKERRVESRDIVYVLCRYESRVGLRPVMICSVWINIEADKG
jgi:hypothetical protein